MKILNSYLLVWRDYWIILWYRRICRILQRKCTFIRSFWCFSGRCVTTTRNFYISFWRAAMFWKFWCLFSITLMILEPISVSFTTRNIRCPSFVQFLAARVGLMHIGVFILLLLSGERNFGVRLNKPYTATIPMDIPVFTGTHADLLIIVFHKIITTGHQRLQPLFDCLLTILVNGE